MSVTDFTLPTMEEFATTDGDTRDAILLRALQHAGEQFGAMTHDMEGLQGSHSRVENEVVALRQEVARSQELLMQAIKTMGKASTGGPKESKSTKTAWVAAPTPVQRRFGVGGFQSGRVLVALPRQPDLREGQR